MAILSIEALNYYYLWLLCLLQTLSNVALETTGQSQSFEAYVVHCSIQTYSGISGISLDVL